MIFRYYLKITFTVLCAKRSQEFQNVLLNLKLMRKLRIMIYVNYSLIYLSPVDIDDVLEKCRNNAAPLPTDQGVTPAPIPAKKRRVTDSNVDIYAHCLDSMLDAAKVRVHSAFYFSLSNLSF